MPVTGSKMPEHLFPAVWVPISVVVAKKNESVLPMKTVVAATARLAGAENHRCALPDCFTARIVELVQHVVGNGRDSAVSGQATDARNTDSEHDRGHGQDGDEFDQGECP